MTDIEIAIFAAAYVDALRNIYEGQSIHDRVQLSQREARWVVMAYRQYAIPEVTPP